MKNKFLFLLALSIVVAACHSNSETLPYYNSADFTPVWLEESDWKRDDLHRIPDFSFVNQYGEEITEKDFENKIYIANFFFTVCPGICPQLTRNMLSVQEAFREEEDVLLLSHTVMPWVDSIPRLLTYAEDHDVIAGKWHLATGSQESIYQIGRQSYFAELESGLHKTADEFLHTENLILIDQDRHIRGVYNGTLALDTQRLIEDIKLLMKES